MLGLCTGNKYRESRVEKAHLADGTHGVELDGDELSETRRVVVTHRLGVTERLEDRVCLVLEKTTTAVLEARKTGVGAYCNSMHSTNTHTDFGGVSRC